MFSAAMQINEAGQYSVAVCGKNDKSIEREQAAKQTVLFAGASSTQGKIYISVKRNISEIWTTLFITAYAVPNQVYVGLVVL